MQHEPEQSLRDQVVKRARNCCEYCCIPAEYVSTPFQLDHIIAEKHGGDTTLDNLAWSCLDCNSFKGPNIAGRDQGKTIPLFNPRIDSWDEHFSWDRANINGKTPTGRATVFVLRMNLPYRVAVRTFLLEERRLPTLIDKNRQAMAKDD